jgi:hypothetical protein
MAQEDKVLDNVLLPALSYLALLKRLHPRWREGQKLQHRPSKAGTKLPKDVRITKNLKRMRHRNPNRSS